MVKLKINQYTNIQRRRKKKYIYICELVLFFCIFHVHVRSQLITKQQCTTVLKGKKIRIRDFFIVYSIK